MRNHWLLFLGAVGALTSLAGFWAVQYESRRLAVIAEGARLASMRATLTAAGVALLVMAWVGVCVAILGARGIAEGRDS